MHYITKTVEHFFVVMLAAARSSNQLGGESVGSQSRQAEQPASTTSQQNASGESTFQL